jgi:hypothetical protein
MLLLRNQCNVYDSIPNPFYLGWGTTEYIFFDIFEKHLAIIGLTGLH